MSLTGTLYRICVEASDHASTSSNTVDGLLSLIQGAQAQASSLNLISSNDTIDDLPTSSIRVIFLDSLQAQAVGRSQTRPGDFGVRKDVLRQSLAAYRKFLSVVVSLNIFNRSTSRSASQAALAAQVKSALSKDSSPLPTDAANRRAAKIAALKLERSYKVVLDEYRQEARAKASSKNIVRATGQGWSNGASSSASNEQEIDTTVQLSTEYDLLILPTRGGVDSEKDDEDDEEDDTFVGGQGSSDEEVKAPTNLRSYLVLLSELHSLQALNALDSTYSELALLASMPSNAEALSRESAGRERDEMQRRKERGTEDEWRLDQRWGASNTAPLLDDKGKPQRPFTILPSGSTAANGQASMGGSAVQNQMDSRQRMREQVFQPSHRLPTMSIDEYLEEEERRGNIISGGGQASADAPTSSELLALRSQGYGVGTREAEEADDEQRRKADEWDDFSESNPKGIGNTMNRG